jgi:hypothetical protein
VGLFSFIVIATAFATVAFWGEAHHPSVTWRWALICACGAAWPAAVAESLPSRVDDNLRVCISAAVGVVVTSRVLQALG